MKFKKIGKIQKGQDGAIWKGFLFRFDHTGKCFVYNLNQKFDGGELPLFSSFKLGNPEKLIPHSNSVMFSNEYFLHTDEFPLLFSNVYNNYQKEENRYEGVCCVYRITRKNNEFTANLVGVVEIGFVNDAKLWCSENHDDIRPYGNFAIDRQNAKLFAFTMRDSFNTTRYFSFNLPKISEAETDLALGIKKITLCKADIEYYFDCEYHHFVQGAAFKDNKIYSLEGFTDSVEAPPALRIISTLDKKQEKYISFADLGLTVEPELIDFFDDTCYYCDHSGNLYIACFE